MSPLKRKLIKMTEEKANKGLVDVGALMGKTEEKTAEAPVRTPPGKEAYGFRLGEKILKMTITATEITRVEHDDDEDGQGLMEVKYKLRWEGVTGKGLEKDVTIRFMMATEEGTEEILVQQEMLALLQEARRKFIN